MGTINRSLATGHLHAAAIAFTPILGILLTFISGMDRVQAAPSRVLQPVPGGIDPRPILYGVTNHQGVLHLSCGGFQSGPFQVVQATNGGGQAWTGIGPQYPSNSFTALVTNHGGLELFRVSGPVPAYAGANNCGQCHALDSGSLTPWDTWYDYWVQTPHARAYQTLIAQNPANATNASCLPCHTVGFGFSSGYAPGKTWLEGVQCENCHGPGGVRHKDGMDVRPAVEWSAMVCGGCHNTDRYRTYDEWKESRHSQTDPEVAALFTNPTNGITYQYRCGVCHSGAMRAFMLIPNGGDIPSGAEAGREGVVCVGCHDPHRQAATPHMLRNPLTSTNAYSMVPPTNWSAFNAQYRADVSLCGQCHNARGAVWTDTARPPHPSLHYNMLLGNIGEMPSGKPPYQPGAHGTWIENQCLGCHMESQPVDTDGKNGVTGHSFGIHSLDSCLDCHPAPGMLIEFTADAVEVLVQRVKSALDQWARTKAPESLRVKYGVRAWEYTSPGEVSNPPGNIAPGPSTAEQALIPANIKKARYDLYLVVQEGSGGIHNGGFAAALLNAAEEWVRLEMAQP